MSDDFVRSWTVDDYRKRYEMAAAEVPEHVAERRRRKISSGIRYKFAMTKELEASLQNFLASPYKRLIDYCRDHGLDYEQVRLAARFRKIDLTARRRSMKPPKVYKRPPKPVIQYGPTIHLGLPPSYDTGDGKSD